MKANPSRAIGAGFLATLVMTILMYTAPLMGLPEMDIAAMLGSMATGDMAAAGSTAWWMGMLIHFINGTLIFSLIYAYLLFGVLPGPYWAKGAQWGLILWFLAQVVVMPMMGMGLFSANAPEPMMSVIGSFLGHLVYGAILGSLAGAQATRIAGPYPGHEEVPHRR